MNLKCFIFKSIRSLEKRRDVLQTIHACVSVCVCAYVYVMFPSLSIYGVTRVLGFNCHHKVWEDSAVTPFSLGIGPVAFIFVYVSI